MPRTAARPQSLRTRWIPIPRRGSRSFGRKNAYRGSRGRRITASRSIRRQVLIASGEIRLSSTMTRRMPVLAQSGVCGPCAPGPSQGGTPGTVWNDGNDGFSNATLGVTVTAGGGSSSVDYISTVAGWIGLAAGAGDPSSGGLSVGTNLRIYSAPRGNQYFTTLTKLSTVFKVYGAGAIIYILRPPQHIQGRLGRFIRGLESIIGQIVGDSICLSDYRFRLVYLPSKALALATIQSRIFDAMGDGRLKRSHLQLLPACC